MKKTQEKPTAARRSAWPSCFAWLLCGLTLSLIAVGGLITTTDAGMAVPDWPGTYGYNLFLYPWQTWFFGPWDLFIEHGHRLLAALVGLVTIGLLMAAWLTPSAERLRMPALLALGLVLFQGWLGGARVLENERLLAMAHGFTAAWFFALTCFLAALSHASPGRHVASLRRAGLLAVVTAAAVVTQLGLGAALRHIPESAGLWTFATLVKLHLLGAGVVVLHAAWLGLAALAGRGWPWATRLAGVAVGGTLVLQFAAGLGAWVLKYGLPAWAEPLAPANITANVANGWWQTTIVTMHQAGGSLLIGLCVFVATRAFLMPPGERPQPKTKTSTTSSKLAAAAAP